MKTRQDWYYGTFHSKVLVENIETGEKFSLDGGGDMKEKETYYLLRAKHSKLFVYEIVD